MSKTPAWYGQMWLIIIDFHLAFLRQPADQKKKKEKFQLQCAHGLWWMELVPESLGKFNSEGSEFWLRFLSCQEEEEPPQIIQWPRACLRVWCQLLLLTGRIHRARLLPLLGYSFLISKVGVLIHCITLSLATTSCPCGLILFGLSTTGAVLAQGLWELLTHLLPWGSPVPSDVWDVTRPTGCPCV